MNPIKKFLVNHNFMKLTGENLKAGEKVSYNGLIYEVGNRKGNLIELYDKHGFVTTVDVSRITIC